MSAIEGGGNMSVTSVRRIYMLIEYILYVISGSEAKNLLELMAMGAAAEVCTNRVRSRLRASGRRVRTIVCGQPARLARLTCNQSYIGKKDVYRVSGTQAKRFIRSAASCYEGCQGLFEQTVIRRAKHIYLDMSIPLQDFSAMLSNLSRAAQAVSDSNSLDAVKQYMSVTRDILHTLVVNGDIASRIQTSIACNVTTQSVSGTPGANIPSASISAQQTVNRDVSSLGSQPSVVVTHTPRRVPSLRSRAVSAGASVGTATNTRDVSSSNV